MATYDLTEYLEDDAIVLEGIRSDTHPEGRSYRFESPSFEVGLWLKNLIEFGKKAVLASYLKAPMPTPDKTLVDDNEELDVFRRVMGDTLDEMRADGVKWESVQRIFALLLKKWGNSQPIEVTLEEGKGAAPNRKTRRAAAKTVAKAPTRARNSSPKAGSRSSRASSATKARTGGRASTRTSKTSGGKPKAASA